MPESGSLLGNGTEKQLDIEVTQSATRIDFMDGRVCNRRARPQPPDHQRLVRERARASRPIRHGGNVVFSREAPARRITSVRSFTSSLSEFILQSPSTAPQ